ncbi:2Fe-2S iron-sulfur cluster binding domain-containing protein [Natronomonas gomsonensis]|uniref:ferredoxin Fer n=1 Tax=Natronomonas gomsonensis TaxID=1046043 RepID=UPI0020CA615F|nr:ferredoxin Fer [Natronomonas gomsonensis]MCY4731431.1 2Fe-2S iron-sulfur cluster binding domain-containing protein [Natronomonas gomsonensis]
MASPFEVLGVEPDADQREIEQAYRDRIKEAHPDHGGSPREFKRVREAYEDIKAGRARSVSDADDGVDAPGEPEPGTDESRERTDEPEESATRVEYLNYDVLADHGWSLEDDDLFDKASAANLDHEDYGRFLAEPQESLLEAAENRGFAWPYACRGGACANCAVAIKDGELSMPVDHILPEEMLDRGIRLSCMARPATDRLQVIYNVKHLPDLDDLLLPPSPFEKAQADD